MFTKNLLLPIFASLVLFSACSEEKDPVPAPAADKCASKNIKLTATVVPAASCSSNGIVTLRATGSAGFTFQQGSSAFQADSVFGGLAAGSYTFTAKDAEGCTKIATITVTENTTKGSMFTGVSALVAYKCNQACHTAGSNGAPKGIFATDCDIVALKSMIAVKSVAGTMGGLNTTEKAQIAAWIAAGGTINN
jgi:hypothetical protein